MSEWVEGEEYNEDDLRYALLTCIIIWATIFIPVTLVGLKVVYYGWKEQEKNER